MKPRYLLFSLPFVFPVLAQAQLVIDETLSPIELVQDVLLGNGVTVNNVSYNGFPAMWVPEPGSGSFTATGTDLGIASGVILSTGFVSYAVGPAFNEAAEVNGTGSDPDLVVLSGGQPIEDQATLEFDFIPTGNTISFRYVFASEEYTGFTCTEYNDAFGFFLSGPGINGPFSNNAVNLAVIPNTTIPITVNTVNSGSPTGGGSASTCAAADPNWQANSQYFVGNQNADDFMFNGFTVTLTAWALVTCGETYHIKLAIGDAADSGLDSGVFIEGGSFASTGQVVPDLTGGTGVDGTTMMEGCGPFEMVFTRLGDLAEEATIYLTMSGTSTELIDYSPAFPDQIYFAPGQETFSFWLTVPPDADGPETLVIDIQQLIACSNQNLTTTFTFNIDSPPPLTVDSYDLNSVCGQSHILDPDVSGGLGEYVYTWDTGDTTATIEVEPGVTTTYELTVSDACAVQSVTVDYTITLPIYLPLEVTMGPDVAIDCLGSDDIEVAGVTGGDGDYTFEWTANGAPQGNGQTITVPAGPPTYYVVTVSEGCGTSVQDSLLVTTVPLDPIVITTTGDVTPICPGDSTLMEITGVTGGNGVYTYGWADQTGQTLSTDTELLVWVNADHTYTITVEDECLNVGSTEITTFLPVYEPFMLNMPSDDLICAGDSISLLAQVQGGSGYFHLVWHDMDHTDPAYVASPMSETQYTVTAIDQCGAERTDEVVIEVEHVSVQIVENNRGQDDWYLQAATTPYALTWVWDMGDGTRYRGPEVVHSYMDLDEHWVTLEIATPNGCEGKDSVLLRPPAHLYFPNAFTPDGDGHNDLFGPVGHYIEEFEMQVFDRWGKPVFITTSPDDWWDGSVNGSGLAQTGVYVYKYKAVGHYFPAVEGYGHVTLLQGSQDF